MTSSITLWTEEITDLASFAITFAMIMAVEREMDTSVSQTTAGLIYPHPTLCIVLPWLENPKII